MSEKVISPDLNFVKDVIKSGGDSLKKCFQCATCTVVCNVAPDDKPFPRKEMVHAQWGLKDELFSNPDIWLCHQCSDCTAYCPRGANPGEVLGTIRQMSLEKYSAPGFLAKAMRDTRYLVFLLAIPVLIILGVLYFHPQAALTDVPRGEHGEIIFAKFMPMTTAIDPLYMAAMIFAVVVLAKGVMAYWADMAKHNPVSGKVTDTLIDVGKDILTHTKFLDCDVTAKRRTSHLLVFYSFVVLAVTTGFAAAREWGGILGIIDSALLHANKDALYMPMKILGNIGAAALVIGIIMVAMNRVDNAEKAGKGSYYDWLFIGLIAVIAATGLCAQLARLGNIANLAYPLYFAHLASVLFLFMYAPFSKMAHMVYRATAMVFARMAGRG
jgi:quinone-modifying oxidoreductase subunit QmoC